MRGLTGCRAAFARAGLTALFVAGCTFLSPWCVAAAAGPQLEATAERAVLFTSLGQHDKARFEYANLAQSAPPGAIRRFAVVEAARSSMSLGEKDTAMQILEEALRMDPDPAFKVRLCSEAGAFTRRDARPSDGLARACGLFHRAAKEGAQHLARVMVGDGADASPPVRVLLARGPSVRLEVPSGASLRINGGTHPLRSCVLTFAAEAGGVRCIGDGVELPCSGDVWLEPRSGHVRLGDSNYGGVLHFFPMGGHVGVVQHVPLETYLKGVIPGEMPSAWPLEALKAQAVTARTYAVAHIGSRPLPFDLYADERSQVYRGQGAGTPATDTAVQLTRGQVLTHGGKPFPAYYHADNGGWMAGAGPGLPGPAEVLVPGPDPARHLMSSPSWRVEVGQAELLAALARLGHAATSVARLAVAETGRGGRALQFAVATNTGTLKVPAARLKALLGASAPRSLLCSVLPAGGRFVFTGRGHGHGVGMSQYGAAALARAGMAYGDILSSYYRGAVLDSMTGTAFDDMTMKHGGGEL